MNPTFWRRSLLFLAAAGLFCSAARAEIEEIFSRYVTVSRPQGEFVQRLIRLRPGGGDGWREVACPDAGLKLAVPADTEADTARRDSRVLQLVLKESTLRPRPVLRVDLFAPGPDDPTRVDGEYAAAYAEAYPLQAFKGKFNVTDSGWVLLRKKTSLALVGGGYLQGAAPAYRLQCAYLSKDRQLFVTFDCAEGEWPQFAATVSRILLSLEVGPPEKR